MFNRESKLKKKTIYMHKYFEIQKGYICTKRNAYTYAFFQL